MVKIKVKVKLVNLFCFFCRRVPILQESDESEKSDEITDEIIEPRQTRQTEQTERTIEKNNEIINEIIVNNNKSVVFPSKVLLIIFSHLDDSESKGLYSCLLVNHYWYSNVISILWKRPFTSRPLSRANSAKLIQTYLLCLDKETKQTLKKSLKQQNFKLSISSKSPSTNYASLLDELDYKILEESIYSYLIMFTRNSNNLSLRRTSADSPPIESIYQHVYLVGKNLFTLFIQENSSLKSLIIDKYCNYSDLPLTEIQQKPSRITKLDLNYYESGNILEFIRSLPTLCKGLLEFNVNICDFENEALVNKSIADVIISQRGLQRFSINGAKNGGNAILIALGGFQSKSLLSARFKLMNFKSTGMKELIKCNQLKELLIENCQGLSIDVIKILFNAKLQSLKKLVIWSYQKIPQVTSLTIESTKNSKLEELTIDIIMIGTVNSILKNGSNIKTLKILDYQPKNNPQMFRLLRGLPSLERLTICRETNVELGVINFSGKYLPTNIKYLRLECGINTDQLKNLLSSLGNRSKLKTLILSYFKLDVTHLKVIVEWVKRRRTLKVLGIGGKLGGFSKGELTELNILRDEYNVFIIPPHKLDDY